MRRSTAGRETTAQRRYQTAATGRCQSIQIGQIRRLQLGSARLGMRQSTQSINHQHENLGLCVARAQFARILAANHCSNHLSKYMSLITICTAPPPA